MQRLSSRSGGWIAAVALVIGATGGGRVHAAKPPKFYFQVRSVQIPAGAPASLKDKAKTALVAELKKQPTVTMDLGDPPPKGADLEKALKAKKLAAYELVLRVVKSNHSLQPPPPGRMYKMLMVEVEVAIDAEKIPSGQMALAGEGSAQVGTEAKTVKEQEKQQLLGEALGEAIKQAVEKSIAKLSSFKANKPPRRKKK